MDLLRWGFTAHQIAFVTSPLSRRDDESAEIFKAASEWTSKNPDIASYAHDLNGVNQVLNNILRDALWWTLGIFCLLVLAVRITELMWAKLRLVSAMSVSGEKQRFWMIKQWSWMPSLKRNLLYAPLGKKRHNREYRLSAAINVGTLPSRFHTIILLIYLGSNLAYMFVLNWGIKNRWAFTADVRGRSGTLAAVNMVPLIILAGRNNPLIGLLMISFDTYNLLHRWIGRVVVIESAIHTIAWAIVQVSADGWHRSNWLVFHDTFYASGALGTLALAIIFITAASPVRHAFYETFLNTHIILAFVVFVCTWIHCASSGLRGGLPQLPWVVAIMVLWFMERFARIVRLVYLNRSSRGYTHAVVEAMPGEACRVTLHLPRYVDVRPGTHAYLRFAGVRPWETHPFSIAWVSHTDEDEVLPVSENKTSKKVKRPATTSVSFIIGAQTGFTRLLYNAALMRADGGRSIHMRAAMEGPYAGHHSLDSYGHAVLFAGATGITHQISLLRHLIQGFNNGTVATRRITLIWAVRGYESLEWVRPWMDEVLRMPRRKEILQVKLFVTRPKNPREIMSASTTVQMFPGRPNIGMLLRKEVQDQMGAMCVTVCGPGGLADSVREAVRMVQDERKVVDFVEESFTW